MFRGKADRFNYIVLAVRGSEPAGGTADAERGEWRKGNVLLKLHRLSLPA